MILSWISLSLLAVAPVFGHPGASPLEHAHKAHAPLPDTWYHPRDHPIHGLFRRQAGIPTDGQTYPQVGSPTWAAAYPSSTPDANAMPQEWKDALNAAVQAGKIPNIPPTSDPNNGNPVYPQGFDPLSPQVCSATYKCRLTGDIWDAPDGVIGVSFDDGPLPVSTSDALYTFLQQNNLKVTHFFIGVNIVNNAKEFLTAFNMQDDISVHTWTHPHMTTLSNEDVVAQLAWTMEIIHNSTGGRVPRYWRPPYGDTDIRVSAIAKEVLGLTTVIWNQDTEDWSVGQPGGATAASVNTNIQKWLTGPKSPGLIMLEHELSNFTVQAFIANFPLIAANNWKPVSVAQLDGTNTPYQNSQGTTGAVTPADILANVGNASSGSAAPGNSSSTSTSSTGTPSSTSHSSTPTNSSSSSGLQTRRPRTTRSRAGPRMALTRCHL
ncbi:hypothetical protein BC834DRAFT_821301 [Gloeopeniophorella convolvens]|nr:hypothetical protein BC834DRAFT_821301 [Gloeopeniophorella convolvens]